MTRTSRNSQEYPELRRGLGVLLQVAGFAWGVLQFSSGCAPSATATPSVVGSGLDWVDLQGERRPLVESVGERGVVLVYLSVDCPIANRCLPEIEALAERLGPRGLKWAWVYAQGRESRDDILRHRAEYGLKVPAFQDVNGSVARAFRVSHTPEAVALDRRGRLIYRGRINDQFQRLGVSRPEATRHDLAEALDEYLNEGAPRGLETTAVGCRFRQ